MEGGIGVLLGLVLTWVLDGLKLGETYSVQAVFSAEVAFLAMGVSAAVGLFFGIYPAARAARLHPIQALQHSS